jgi:CHAT domain-containing protein/tetratricopeptide (TPR) repeat protein
MRINRNALLVTSAIIVMIAFCKASYAQNSLPQVSLYDDPRIVSWSKDFLAGKREEVIRSVEQDLKSSSPHPFAPHVWTFTQNSLGRLEQMWPSLADPVLRKALGEMPEIFLLYKAGARDRLLEKYPPSKAAAIKDPQALLYLYFAAFDEFRYLDGLSYMLVFAKLYPELFQSVWGLGNCADNDDRVWLLVTERVKQEGDLAHTYIGQALRILLSSRPMTNQMKIAAARAWLADSPHDARALRYLANQLKTVNAFENALDYYRQSTEIYPFGMTAVANWEERAEILLRLGRDKEAQDFITRKSELDSKDSAAKELLVARNSVSSNIQAGEKGAARRALEAALKRFPEDAYLLDYLANLELSSNSTRYSYGLSAARKAAQADPQNESIQRRLIEAVEKVEGAEKAYLVWKDVKKRFPKPSLNFYYQGSQLLESLKRNEDRVRLCEEAVRMRSVSWFLREYADALNSSGRNTEALDQLKTSLTFTTKNNWVFIKLREWTINQQSNAKAEQSLQQMLIKYPWAQKLWQDAVEQLGDGKIDEKLALWRQAVEKNPGAYWPWSEATSLLFSSNKLEDARSLAGEAMVALKRLESPNAVNVYSGLIWGAIRKIRNGTVTASDLQEALKDLDSYKDGGGNLNWYNYQRATILLALGKKREAWQSALTAAQINPENSDYFWFLFNGDFGDERKGRWLHVRHYWDRDPYDGKRLGYAAKAHIDWGGSPIVGYQLLQQCKENDPSIATKDLEARALGILGDDAEHYMLTYARNKTGLAPSDRYIAWYDEARKRAQRSILSVKVKTKTGLAQVIYADGMILQRMDHSVSVKLVLLQVGPVFVKAEYEPMGEYILALEASSGLKIYFKYDDKGRIKMLTQGDQVIHFEYNERDKPIRVILQGSGEIIITYTENSEIEKVESSDGRQIALQVTHTLQNIMDLFRKMQEVLQSGLNGNYALDLMESFYKDPDLDKLVAIEEDVRAKLLTTSKKVTFYELIQARLAIASNLVSKIKDRRKYAGLASEILLDVYDEVQKSPKDNRMQAFGVEAVCLWHELFLKIKPNGLPRPDYEIWAKLRLWLNTQVDNSQMISRDLLRVIQKIEASPLELLQDAAWLPESYVGNDAYWRRISFPKEAPADSVTSTTLMRRNHDVVIGTNKGLAVWRGYWLWPVLSSYINETNVLSLAEDASGNLWVGTTDGLFRFEKDSYDNPRCWNGIVNGLPLSRVDHLAVSGDKVFIGTSKGLAVFAGDDIYLLLDFSDQEIEFLHSSMYTASDGTSQASSENEPVIVGTLSGVFATDATKVLHLTEKIATDAVWSKGLGKVFVLRNSELYGIAWDGAGQPGEMVYVRGQQNVRKTKKVFRLSQLPIDKEVEGIAVLTDLGLSIFYNERFEYKQLPFADSLADARELSTAEGRTVINSSQGIYILESGRVMGDRSGRVFDILTADDLGLTFVARGTSLQVVRNESPQSGAQLFESINATRLARHPDGRLISNDGLRIVTYDKNWTHTRDLFNAKPTLRQEYTEEPQITSILAASDGTVWVTAGQSVFRHRDGKTEEFSIFIDPERFPAQSDMISRVIETVDGRILVVASNEEHRYYNRMQLSGGLLQWMGNSFKRIEVDRKNHTSLWFITGYTPIDQKNAIVATCGAFAREREGRLAPFPLLKDASYQNLSERISMLWLGTKGARLGKDLWLFGCAGGIVAYKDGQWFYPDRLNWMLPDQHLAQYGARTVHAIATDKNGFVYAGTDRGLMIYDSGGGDVAALMMINDRPDIAYAALEQTKLQREAEILLQAIKPGSELANRVEKILQGRSRIEELKDKLSTGMSARIMEAATVNTAKAIQQEIPEGENKRLREELDQRIRAQTQLLLELERDNRSLYQMLELKPLDLIALGERLQKGQIVIQYLPTKEKLYILVITSNGPPELKEIPVKSEVLLPRAKLVARALAQGGGRGPLVKRDLEMATLDLTSELCWLYDNLLRPVENHLKDSKHVFIVPVDALSYLPFGALVRSKTPVVEYAVQKYVFGYLPSHSWFDLFREEKKISSREALIIGDPDGSLPGARSEAEDVKAILGGSIPTLVGNDATYENFVRISRNARYIHLATHGYLDDERPERSYLLMANGYRLSVVDICTMQSQFAEADLAVLSACETGRGKEGMEYATLARAFATAKVPSIVATLWRINDAKSPEIIKMYYGNMAAGDDRLTALAKAQREMIAGDKDRNNPSVWSGFIVFGKP